VTTDQVSVKFCLPGLNLSIAVRTIMLWITKTQFFVIYIIFLVSIRISRKLIFDAGAATMPSPPKNYRLVDRWNASRSSRNWISTVLFLEMRPKLLHVNTYVTVLVLHWPWNRRPWMKWMMTILRLILFLSQCMRNLKKQLIIFFTVYWQLTPFRIQMKLSIVYVLYYARHITGCGFRKQLLKNIVLKMPNNLCGHSRIRRRPPI